MSSNVRAVSLPRSQNYVGAEHGAFVSVCRVRKTWLLFSDSHWTGVATFSFRYTVASWLTVSHCVCQVSGKLPI